MNKEDRAKIVNDLVNMGLISIESSKVMLGFSPPVPKKWSISKNKVNLTYPNGHVATFTREDLSKGSYPVKFLYNLSQDEIDQIQKELAEEKAKDEAEQLSFAYVSSFNPPLSGLNPNFAYLDETPNTPKLCKHEWVEYLGLNERFDHCKTCGEKKI